MSAPIYDGMTRSARWAAKNRAASRAHRLLNNAVKSGRLVRPAVCQRCGEIPKRRKDGRSSIQGHHWKGYDRPLDVRWICPLCHITEDPGRTKLTKDDVIAIRKMVKAKTSLRTVGRLYQLDHKTVRQIANRESWAHVD